MEPTTQSTYDQDQQAILLKGFANQILQMNKPNFGHLQKFLEDFEITQEVSGKFQYTYDEVHRALLMCAIITNGIGKREEQTFGERVCEVLHYALNYTDAYKAVQAEQQSLVIFMPHKG